MYEMEIEVRVLCARKSRCWIFKIVYLTRVCVFVRSRLVCFDSTETMSTQISWMPNTAHTLDVPFWRWCLSYRQSSSFWFATQQTQFRWASFPASLSCMSNKQNRNPISLFLPWNVIVRLGRGRGDWKLTNSTKHDCSFFHPPHLTFILPYLICSFRFSFSFCLTYAHTRPHLYRFTHVIYRKKQKNWNVRNVKVICCSFKCCRQVWQHNSSKPSAYRLSITMA